MGEVRDRGVLASEPGQRLLEQARASKFNEKGRPWSYANVAIEVGCDERTVRRFFHREQAIDRAYAYKICHALGVELNAVLNSPDFDTLDPSSQISSNPFNYGTPVPPDGFYGRAKAIADVKNRIGAVTAQSINIVGLRRIGKSSLLRYIKERTEVFCRPECRPLIVLLDLQDLRFHSPEGMIEGLRRSLKQLIGREPWSVEDNQDAYAVEDGLQALKDQGYRLVVMLDEFEAVGRRLEIFQDWGEDWRAKACAQLFTLVVASKRPIQEVYQQLHLTSPFGNIFSTTILGALEEESWQQLVRDGLGNEGVSRKTLQWIDALAGGFPFYVQMAASLLWQCGNLEEAEQEFCFQATARFEELWQNLNETERTAIKYAGSVPGLTAPASAMTERLQRNGLLQPNEQLFSNAFARYVRGQR
jgi:hypothetical protein